MRLNGVVELPPEPTGHGPDAAWTFRVHAQQVYANCQKYIQAREWTARPAAACSGGDDAADTPVPARASALTADQRDWIERADTFFIATAHAENGADASHRGGLPGFARVEDERRLLFADYAGNMMFNTLGNIVADPRAGLLFVDFERRATLQLTGRAEVIWDSDQAATFAGLSASFRSRSRRRSRRRTLPYRPVSSWSIRRSTRRDVRRYASGRSSPSGGPTPPRSWHSRQARTTR